jgi:chromate reductase, NAD(P)H dehydrogenase (quinone)
MNRTANLVLISGSLREGPTNTAVVRTLPGLLGDWARTLEYRGMAALPHFNRDDDAEPLPAEVARLRRAVAEADAVLFCTPEYAGDLPGSFKNLLDWTVGGTEIVDKPVGWINASSFPTGAEGAHRALRTVLGYTGARLVEEACAGVPVPRTAVDAATGTVTDPGVRQALAEVAHALVEHAVAGWGDPGRAAAS